MIIFYNKTSGEITGTVEGRIHDSNQLRVWIGDKKKTERIVVGWEKDKTKYIPKHIQRDLFVLLDKKPIKVYEYKVNIKTQKLEKK